MILVLWPYFSTRWLFKMFICLLIYLWSLSNVGSMFTWQVHQREGLPSSGIWLAIYWRRFLAHLGVLVSDNLQFFEEQSTLDKFSVVCTYIVFSWDILYEIIYGSMQDTPHCFSVLGNWDNLLQVVCLWFLEVSSMYTRLSSSWYPPFSTLRVGPFCFALFCSSWVVLWLTLYMGCIPLMHFSTTISYSFKNHERFMHCLLLISHSKRKWSKEEKVIVSDLSL